MEDIKSRKGFTLIEMLVVIAIIAILVATVVPLFANSTNKAKAAADAANMRTILAEVNILLIGDATADEAAAQTVQSFTCSSFSGAEMKVLYHAPGFMDVYFISDGNYYSIEYFAELAEKGDASQVTTSTANPTTSGDIWYSLGTPVGE